MASHFIAPPPIKFDQQRFLAQPKTVSATPDRAVVRVIAPPPTKFGIRGFNPAHLATFLGNDADAIYQQLSPSGQRQALRLIANNLKERVQEKRRIRSRSSCLLVSHLEGRAVFGPGLAVVVDAGGGDVGVPEPFLDLGLAMSASWSGALVAAVARRAWAPLSSARRRRARRLRGSSGAGVERQVPGRFALAGDPEMRGADARAENRETPSPHTTRRGATRERARSRGSRSRFSLIVSSPAAVSLRAPRAGRAPGGRRAPRSGLRRSRRGGV